MEKLIREEVNEAGEKVYKMASFDIEVIAKHSGGIAPTITYMLHDEDVTEDIRQLRFYYKNPATFIEDFPQFQSMLFDKEQRAINNLYDQYSIRPKNMTAGKQVLWSFFVLLLITIPLFVVILIVK